MTTHAKRVDLDELAALEEQRAFLLTSLDDLDREHAAGDLDDADFGTLRADYTSRAARVIEAIEDRHELIDATDTGRRGVRRLLVGFVVIAVAAVAGLVVTTTWGTDRTSSGDPGGLQPSEATQKCIDMMQEAFVPAEGEGEDADGVVDVLECFTEQVDQDPTDAVAYTYRGRTLALLARQLEGVAAPGDVQRFTERSRSDLAEALELAPEYPDALVFATLGALADGDVTVARAYLDRIDRLQLPANNPILPIVNNAIRPALTDTGTASSTTTTMTTVP